MKISSYNITDVGYHYIGLRVLSNSELSRDEQLQAIARGVLKYASDRALRLLLPEPKGNFSTVGEKVCQELVHFNFAVVEKGGYELTEAGKEVLGLLNDRRFLELRRAMTRAHLATYDNLRAVVQQHMELGNVWRCTIEVEQMSKPDYIERLLKPTFGEKAFEKAAEIKTQGTLSPKQTEDLINESIISEVFKAYEYEYSVPLFRALCDRLMSLRLLNTMRAKAAECDFLKSYSPCVLGDPSRHWYKELDIRLSSHSTFKIFLCEPNMSDAETLNTLLGAINEAFTNLKSEAGYYDLPDVRDFVCERLKIPELAFDEGVNSLLDQTVPPLSPGLRYERISARRKPLVRTKATGQIHNLIRRS
ncbi:MAG TPA: hypothetical protein VGO57_04900 [Verrucomicrobiae bacterium]|jgi:hypothetical protein